MEQKELTYANVLESLNMVESNMRGVILTLQNWKQCEEYNLSPNEIPELSERLAQLHGTTCEQYEDYLNELLKLSPHDRPLRLLSLDIAAIVQALKNDGDFIINTNNVPLANKMLAFHTLFNEIKELFKPIWEKNKGDKTKNANKYALEVSQLIFMISANFRFVKQAWEIQGKSDELLSIPGNDTGSNAEGNTTGSDNGNGNENKTIPDWKEDGKDIEDLQESFKWNRELCEKFVNSHYGKTLNAIAKEYITLVREKKAVEPFKDNGMKVAVHLYGFFVTDKNFITKRNFDILLHKEMEE